MRELDTLYIARKHDRVIAHNGSAAKRMDSDLTARPLADLALPPVDCRLVKVSATACRGGLRKHERRSRWRILLVAVVHLRHLDVVFRAKDFRGLPDELEKEVHAKRVVAALHDRDLLRRRIDGLLLVGGEAGRSDDVGNPFLGGLGDRRRNRRVEREVNYALSALRPFAIVSVRDVDLGDNLAASSLSERTEHLAHSTSRTQNCNFHIIL